MKTAAFEENSNDANLQHIVCSFHRHVVAGSGLFDVYARRAVSFLGMVCRASWGINLAMALNAYLLHVS